MSLTNALKQYVSFAAARQPAKISTTYNGNPLELVVFPTEYEGEISGKTVSALWRTQPHLRTVVDYIASNIAQLGVHVFERTTGGNRERVREGLLADLIGRPNPNQTLTEFLRALVTQMALYSDAFVWVQNFGNGHEMRVIPNTWVTVKANAFGEPQGYVFSSLGGKKEITVSPDEVLRFPGWTPDNPAEATSPVETLRVILEEQYQAQKYRQQIWSRSGRFGGYLTRPKDAPEWGDEERQRFMRMWQEFTGENGSQAGKNPLLEDGIEFKRTGFSAREEQWAESTKISLETVCQVYHVPPVMVGITDDANYSNVTAYARQLYTNTLGAWLVQIEQRFNTFLAPMVGAPPEQFLEFNVEAKLRGDFAEQYQILSTATGAPFLTRNEARRVLNYGPVAGGDEVITPLNVLAGGQASPQDGGEGRPAEPGGADSAPSKILEHTAKRIRKSAGKRQGVELKEWFNRERWERELTADLTAAKQDPTISGAFLDWVETEITTKGRLPDFKGKPWEK